MTSEQDFIDLKLNIDLTLTAVSGSGVAQDLGLELRNHAYAAGWRTFWLDFVDTVVRPGTPSPAPVYIPRSALATTDGYPDDDEDFSDELEEDFPSFVWSYEVEQLASARAYSPNTDKTWTPAEPGAHSAHSRAVEASR